MSARPCQSCNGLGRHEVWAMSPSEPVRVFVCTVCHGKGRTEPKPLAPLALVARAVTQGSPCPPSFRGARRGWLS